MFSYDSRKELVDAIWRMAYIAEYREGGNITHLERIKGYVQVLGRGLGLTQNEIQLIATACQLHDIGKVGLSEALLLKEGQYTETELNKIKRHTTLGADILKNSHAALLQHTHVGTIDARVLPRGTAFVTDIGMVGPSDSIIGDCVDDVIRRFLTHMPQRLSVGKGPVIFNSVLVETEPDTGLSISITRIDKEVD